MRGQVMFVVVNTYTKRYLKQYPGLRGAMFFASDITPTSDDIVFLEPANERYDANQVHSDAVYLQCMTLSPRSCATNVTLTRL